MQSVPLWRQIQKENFTDWEKLIAHLQLNAEQAEQILLKSSSVPLNVPRRLAEKMAKGDWNDPVLLQFLPTLKETEPSPLFVLDPVADGT